MKKTKASAVQNSAVMKLDGMLSKLKSDTAKNTGIIYAALCFFADFVKVQYSAKTIHAQERFFASASRHPASASRLFAGHLR